MRLAYARSVRSAGAVIGWGSARWLLRGAAICLVLSASLAHGQSKKSKLPQADKSAPSKPVTQVDPATAERAKLAAAKIDSLVEANYAKHSITPNPMTSDEQFVRRIYLDITGTIPTFEQTVAFLTSRDPDKRAKLIDHLLGTPGYVSHSFNYWANILRLVDYPDPNIPAAPYIQWVKDSIRENKPYDQWVREMLTAEGKIWDNPATGYMLRDSGMPLDSVNNTVRVFLGTQIGCAQCHDHPFDRWTQKEFYEIAAYSFGVRTRYVPRTPAGNPVAMLQQQLSPKTVPMGSAALHLVRANTYMVKDDTKLLLKLPHDYQYSDAKPNSVVKPHPIFGDAPIPPGQSPRVTFARWMTSKENPRFAKTIANRSWKRALGVGLIEPVDDLRDDSEAENPELMNYLITIVTKLDFDLKEFQRIIYNTKTYQRQSSLHELAAGDTYHFPGPILRRMTAEQAWDSLLTLAVYDPDAFQRPSTDGMAAAADLDLVSITQQQVLDKWPKYDEQFGRASMREMRKKYGYKGQMLARASEQPLPAPLGHFLREFGQGDREQIEAATTEGNVPQILTVFNGPVTHMMLEEGSVIFDNVVRAKTVNDRIEVIFLSILSRRPTNTHKQLAIRELAEHGKAGYGDVIWSLLNTREFLFVQ